jgi:ribosomal protein L11 methyltransferase
MKWLEIHIDTNHTGLEPLETFLSSLGIDGVVIDDEDEFRAFLESNRQCWGSVDEALLEQERGRSRVTFYLEDSEEGYRQLAAVRIALSAYKKEHADSGTLLMTVDNLEDADWENNWMQYYQPIEIGQRLLVVPEWKVADTDVGGRVSLILNPGLTFGTGSHATTRLCLTALEQAVHGGEQVLDLGCGSGILSIAALKLGAARAFACDIDDKCSDTSYENAALNGVGRDVYTVRCGDVLTDDALRAEIGGGYDVVLANIVADVIIGLAPAVRPLLKPNGLFICSGIIDTRAVEVADHLRLAGLAILETHEADGWFCYVCR